MPPWRPGELQWGKRPDQLGMNHPDVLVRQIQQLREAGSPKDAAAAASDGCRRGDVRKRSHLACMTGEEETIFLLFCGVGVRELQVRRDLSEVAQHVLRDGALEHR